MIFFFGWSREHTFIYTFKTYSFIWLHRVSAAAGEIFIVAHSEVHFSCSLAGGILVPQPGIKPVSPACKVDS